jgi:hypothetical protein
MPSGSFRRISNGVKKPVMPHTHSKTLAIILILISAIILWGCGTSTPTTSPPEIVTVVETIPVEVTRLVEVTQIVEVVQEVIVTEIIEIPVTVTPQPPTETPVSEMPTETPDLPTHTPVPPLTDATLSPYAGFTPEARGNGWLPFFIENQTDSQLAIVASGPIPFNRVVWNGQTIKVWLREGKYTYSVWEDGNQKYTGSYNITNIDKHQLFLRENDGKFWYP